MLGIKTHVADATLAAGCTTFALNQLVLGQLTLGFNVEEQEMLVDLELSVTLANSISERTDFTLFVDGVDIAYGVNGLSCITPAAAVLNTLYLNTTRRLVRGYHVVEMRAKAPTGAITVAGATIPAVLVARRHSHPATLGHGVDSKVQLIQ